MIAVVVFYDFWPFEMRVHYYEKHTLLERTSKINMYTLPWLGWPIPRMEWCHGWGISNRLAVSARLRQRFNVAI